MSERTEGKWILSVRNVLTFATFACMCICPLWIYSQSRASVAVDPPEAFRLEPNQDGHVVESRKQLPYCSLQHVDVIDGIYSLPGEYKKHREIQKPPYGLDCPFNNKLYACEEIDPSYAQQQAQLYYAPDKCRLRKFNAVRFLKCIANRRLIFIGDSLTNQQFTALTCALVNGQGGLERPLKYNYSTDRIRHSKLYPEVPPKAYQNAMPNVPATYEFREDQIFRFTKPWFGEDRSRVPPEIVRMYCQDWFDDKCKMTRAAVNLPMGVSVELERVEKYEHSDWRLMWNHYRQYTGHESDIIVFNVAVFYFYEFKLFRDHMISILDSFDRQLTPTNRVFIREFSQSHFALQEEGMYSGPECQKYRCQPLASNKGFRHYSKITTELLLACKAGKLAREDEPGILLAQTYRCNNIDFLPLFHAMVSQHGSHAGMFVQVPHIKVDNQSAVDCQHWCAPSAVLETWTAVLDNFLCPATS